uniref:NADH dehydrogenase [ubiquinone] 1 alpha subcomplex assembly factor 5 n=1 Tax=Cacopsylla melanoneura TaxID=428564 RepID=A0A8D9B328_9HEMI
MFFRHSVSSVLISSSKVDAIRSVSTNSKLYFHKTLVCPNVQQSRNELNDQIMYVFNRENKVLQKERLAKLEDVEVYDYLKDEVGYRLSDRVFDIKKKFNTAVDLGCGRGHVSKNIQASSVEKLIMCDNSQSILSQAITPEDTDVIYEKKLVDEENIPFAENSIDLLISNLSLHWVNNLPGCFQQVMKCLKPDGVFLASLFGGETLYELRSAVQLAELERCGGVASHVSPFVQIRDVGSLLNRAGFSMLTIDVDEIVINYPSLFELMWDLKGMGENNASVNRTLRFPLDLQYASAAVYEKFYGQEAPEKNGGGMCIPATFQIIYLVAWKPDPSQPKPLARGSAEVSLKDLHRIDDIAKKKGFIKFDENKD